MQAKQRDSAPRVSLSLAPRLQNALSGSLRRTRIYATTQGIKECQMVWSFNWESIATRERRHVVWKACLLSTCVSVCYPSNCRKTVPLPVLSKGLMTNWPHRNIQKQKFATPRYPSHQGFLAAVEYKWKRYGMLAVLAYGWWLGTI
jgi:hypothetical protein